MTDTDPASQLLQQYRDQILKFDFSADLAEQLHVDGLISEISQSTIESCGGKMKPRIFRELLKSVVEDHAKLIALVSIMMKIDASLATELLRDSCKNQCYKQKITCDVF